MYTLYRLVVLDTGLRISFSILYSLTRIVIKNFEDYFCLHFPIRSCKVELEGSGLTKGIDRFNSHFLSFPPWS